MAEDPHDLARFVAAQDPVWAQVTAELQAGAKRSHWMWFVFPQIGGLGTSRKARHYAIESRAEAEAYLAHPMLGSRLRAATKAVLAHAGTPPERIFGGIDAQKLRSSMTLFEGVAEDPAPFAAVLDRFHAGERCAPTRRWLDAG